jgi:quinol monooxygenase YgiN
VDAVLFIVEVKTKLGQRDSYVAQAQTHRINVLANEPECDRYDIFVPDDDENTVFLYEVYADMNAVETHFNTAYMKTYGEATASLVKDRNIRRYSLANESIPGK